MTDEKNQIKFFLYENWARTKTGQHTVANQIRETDSRNVVVMIITRLGALLNDVKRF